MLGWDMVKLIHVEVPVWGSFPRRIETPERERERETERDKDMYTSKCCTRIGIAYMSYSLNS